MNHAVFRLRHGFAFLGIEKVIDLLLGDIDVAHHVALLHTLDREVIPETLASGCIALPGLLQRDFELLEREPILLGQTRHGFVELLIRDSHAVAVSEL